MQDTDSAPITSTPSPAPSTPAPAPETATYSRADLLVTDPAQRQRGVHLDVARRFTAEMGLTEEEQVRPWEIAGALHFAGNPDAVNLADMQAHLAAFRDADPHAPRKES